MESEVETILNEIRAQVRAPVQDRATAAVTVQEDSSVDPALDHTANGHASQNEALARVSAHLTTTARAWDKLPPVFSNRGGVSARIEIWIKARLKTLSRWFTWEQVNFNAAVHHALAETVEAFSAHEKQLRALRSELNREAEGRRSTSDKNERDLQAVRDEIEALASESRRQAAKHASDLERQGAAAETRARETRAALEEITTRLAQLAKVNDLFSAQTVAINARLSELAETSARLSEQTADADARAAEQSAEVSAQLSNQTQEMSRHLSDLAVEISSSLAGLATEIARVSSDLREEQRVCFKQLSLEASEAAVLEDRGRRANESRLEELEKRNSGRP
jgi:chromosome segregation ATPase